jgi:two-component system C4-dicarboxylate transport response regulator DctD
VRQLKVAAEESLFSGSTWDREPVERGLMKQVAAFEASLLRQALSNAGGNVRLAANALELPVRTFYDKLVRYGISDR